MSRPAIVARRIGGERQPIAIVEDFHPDPDRLRDLARTARFAPARHHYPGIRAALPADYFTRVRPVLATILRAVFDHDGPVDLIDASFSIVTTRPYALTVEQRLPHVDALQPGRIALVHYLGGENGGTAFYRHRATGFETIDAARSAAYLAQLNAELRSNAPPRAYLCGDTPLFEQIDTVEARANRAIVYRSAILHSGAIPPGATLDADPATGRLTVTAFLSAG